jgi:hypothetical protein
MADEIKPSVLDEEKTLELHEQGVVAWNQEMAKRPTDVTFSGELDNCDFKGYVFSGKAKFDRVVFNDNALFECAEFQSWASFIEATFKYTDFFKEAKFINDDMYIFFYRSIFKSLTSFKEVNFHSEVSFSGCEFHGRTNFVHSTFGQYTLFDGVDAKSSFIFFGAEFTRAPSFSNAQVPPDLIDGMIVNYAKAEHDKAKPTPTRKDLALNAGDCHRYRQLKCFAIEARNHAQEQRFFAMEMRAKRGHVDKQWSSNFISHLYEWSSNFGGSILRPVLGFIGSIVVSAFFYTLFSSGEKFFLGFIYALANALPFIGLGRQSAELQLQLFPDFSSWSILDTSLFYFLLSLNSLFAFLFLFLIGLGLRNRFRL